MDWFIRLSSSFVYPRHSLYSINVPTTAAMGGNMFDSSKVEVFKATLTWEQQERVFVVKEVEQRP